MNPATAIFDAWLAAVSLIDAKLALHAVDGPMAILASIEALFPA